MGILNWIGEAIAARAAAEAHERMAETERQLTADLEYAVEQAIKRAVKGCVCPAGAERTCGAGWNCGRLQPITTQAPPMNYSA